jgi:NADPH2:quinone reductase
LGSKVPFTPGLDGVGTVSAVGPDVKRVKVGDRVAVWPDKGSYAEVVTAREDLVVPVDASISDEAAASMTALVTAWNILHVASHLERFESVLIHAAAGGVGSILVQMAREIGVEKIFATAGSPEKLAIARELGAHTTIDYRTQDFAQVVLDGTGGKGVDVICDAIGGDVFANGLRALADFGRHVVYGQSSGSPGTLRTDALHRSNRSVLGYSSGHRRRNRPKSLQPAIAASLKLVAAGRVKILEGGRFPLRDAAKAQELVESRASIGRVFMTV